MFFVNSFVKKFTVPKYISDWSRNFYSQTGEYIVTNKKYFEEEIPNNYIFGSIFIRDYIIYTKDVLVTDSSPYM